MSEEKMKEFEAVSAKTGEVVVVPCPRLGCVLRVKRLSAGQILSLSKGENASVALVAAAVVKKDGAPVYADVKAALADGWEKIKPALDAVHQVNGIEVAAAGKN